MVRAAVGPRKRGSLRLHSQWLNRATNTGQVIIMSITWAGEQAGLGAGFCFLGRFLMSRPACSRSVPRLQGMMQPTLFACALRVCSAGCRTHQECGCQQGACHDQQRVEVHQAANNEGQDGVLSPERQLMPAQRQPVLQPEGS